MCFLTSVEDFRGRLSDEGAVLELVQKALKEVECVMEGRWAWHVWYGCVGVFIDWLLGVRVCEGEWRCWGNHLPPAV